MALIFLYYWGNIHRIYNWRLARVNCYVFPLYRFINLLHSIVNRNIFIRRIIFSVFKREFLIFSGHKHSIICICFGIPWPWQYLFSDLSVDKMTALIRRARFIDIVVLPIPGRPQLMTITLKWRHHKLNNLNRLITFLILLKLTKIRVYIRAHGHFLGYFQWKNHTNSNISRMIRLWLIVR
jgi:hypothetical protein